MRTNELILYKDMEDGELLQDMTFLMENYNNEYYNEDDMKSLLYSTIGDLTELSVSHGFEGNLWHTYLTYLMVSHENAYSTSCEIVGPVEGSINIANWGFTKHFVLSIPKKGQESCQSQRLLTCTWMIWWDTRWQRKN